MHLKCRCHHVTPTVKVFFFLQLSFFSSFNLWNKTYIYDWHTRFSKSIFLYHFDLYLKYSHMYSLLVFGIIWVYHPILHGPFKVFFVLLFIWIAVSSNFRVHCLRPLKKNSLTMFEPLIELWAFYFIILLCSSTIFCFIYIIEILPVSSWFISSKGPCLIEIYNYQLAGRDFMM